MRICPILVQMVLFVMVIVAERRKRRGRRWGVGFTAMVRNRGRSGDVVRRAVGRSGTRKKKREREGCWGGWDVVEAAVWWCRRWVYEEHERGLVKMEVLRHFGVAAVRRSRRPETVRRGEENGERVV
ncbi:hypothetical protein HAX54_019646 [Datura stramonium]|uniref:Secreted protein n=1 Tax=Datura stramonium TaxID=4076 RepID=A0ABS8US04_DATST|nr:hypothetical protein [Datura stramonium]